MASYSTKMVEDDVKDVLRNSVYDGNLLKLPGDPKDPMTRLDPKLYKRVDDVLKRLGGRWDRKLARHVFGGDAGQAVAAIMVSGVAPAMNPHAFFETPPDVADLFVEHLSAVNSIEPLMFLEPSAGTGSLVKALRRRFENAYITAFEVDQYRASQIPDHPRTLVYHKNFLEVVPDDYLVDGVVMNPPFAVEGNKTAYIDHIQHAFKFLMPGGILVSVLPSGWNSNRSKKFRQFGEFFSEADGYCFELPEKCFEASGTGCHCHAVRLSRGRV